MSFSKITNPLTNQTFSIFSTEGKNLLKHYVKYYKNLTRWYLDIAKREAVIKGFDFMQRGEIIPLP